MPFPHFEITDTSARQALTIGLGLAQIVLGLMEIVQGFQQSNKAVVAGGLKVVIDGALAIRAIVNARERSWEDVGRQIVDIVVSLVLFKRFWQGHV